MKPSSNGSRQKLYKLSFVSIKFEFQPSQCFPENVTLIVPECFWMTSEHRPDIESKHYMNHIAQIVVFRQNLKNRHF